MKRLLFIKGIVFLFLFLSAGLGVLPAFGEYNTEVGVNTNRFLNYTGDSVLVNLYARFYNTGGKKTEKPKFIDTDIRVYRIQFDEIVFRNEISLKNKKPVRGYKTRIRFNETPNNYGYPQGLMSFKIKELPPGAYLINVSAPKTETIRKVFIVTKLAVICKSDYEYTKIYVQDLKTEVPIPDAELIIKSNKGKVIERAKTDKNGFAGIPVKNFKQYMSIDDPRHLKNYMFVLIKKGNEENIEFISSRYNEKERQQKYRYVYSDRPIYRPDQKVYIKGFVRYKTGDVYQTVINQKVYLKIVGPNYENILKRELMTDKFGSINTEFTLLKDVPLGRYYISLNDDEKSFDFYQSESSFFNVEEYRKPEFEIKVLPFKEYTIQGKKTKVDVQARYLFGAPVANTPFEYSITEAYSYFDLFSYYNLNAIKFEQPEYYTEEEEIGQGRGHTDNQGNAIISFPTSKRPESSIFCISVKMRDSSDREIEGKGYVRANPGLYEIKMKADKKVCYGDEKITTEIYAKAGKKILPAIFKIRVSRKTTSDLYGDDFRQISEHTISSGGDGKAAFIYKPEESGFYKIKAYSRDKQGNTLFNICHFLHISNKSESFLSSPYLTILTDKEKYKPGDMATAYIIAPAKDKKLLVTIEAEKLYLSKYIKLKGNIGIFRFPVKEDYAPNVYISAGFYNNGSFNGMFNIIRVPDTKHKLQLSIIPDKNEYKPAETAIYNIKTCDSDGKPVSAQVTLGIADKSVFLLAEDFIAGSLHNCFYNYRDNLVSTYPFTFNEEREYFAPMRKPPMPMFSAHHTFNDLKPGFIDPTTAKKLSHTARFITPPKDIRSYFPDTCYFNPNIITDQNGNAQVSVKLPDSLTTWRADAKGITMDTKVGETESEVRVSKKLLVRLITPRFIRQRDKLVISGIVHNNLKTTKTVKMELESTGVKMISAKGIEINLPPGQNRKTEWKIEAPFSGEAEFTLKGMTDEKSDGVKLNVPILPHGTEHQKNISGFTEKRSEFELDVPQKSVPGTLKLGVNISPSLSATVIPALKYLADYPYGCTEQTLSRFLPAVYSLKYLKNTGILSEEVTKNIQEVARKSLQRLDKLQHLDGGWGWWENDKSSAEFTSMVVYSLSQTRDIGYAECDIRSGIQWLYQNYYKEKNLNTRALMLHALTFAGKGQKKWADALFKSRKKLTTDAQAKLAQTLFKMGKLTQADTMLKLLEKKAITTQNYAYWTNDNNSWFESQNYVTASALRAFIMVKPQHPICSKVVRYLSSIKKDGHWDSTNDTSMATMAILEYIHYTKELKGDFTGSLKINDKEVKAFSIKAAGEGNTGFDLELSGKDLKTGKNIISFEKNGAGRLYYSLNLSWFDTEENIKASGNRFFRQTRKFYLLNNKKSADGKQRAKLLKAPYTKIKKGDTIIVQTTCISKKEMEYAITENPKPSGFEITQTPKNLIMPDMKEYYEDYWSYRTENRDDRMVEFRWMINKGKNISIYALKPETEGVFHTMPSVLSLMYIPELSACSDEMIFEVVSNKNEKSISEKNKATNQSFGGSFFARVRQIKGKW